MSRLRGNYEERLGRRMLLPLALRRRLDVASCLADVRGEDAVERVLADLFSEVIEEPDPEDWSDRLLREQRIFQRPGAVYDPSRDPSFLALYADDAEPA